MVDVNLNIFCVLYIDKKVVSILLYVNSEVMLDIFLFFFFIFVVNICINWSSLICVL